MAPFAPSGLSPAYVPPQAGEPLRILPTGDIAGVARAEPPAPPRPLRGDDPLHGARDEQLTALAAFIRQQFEMMRRHRQGSTGCEERLVKALRMYNGEYDPETLRAIEEFGGSRIYARVVAMKCRGATSLLRDIYLTGMKSWTVEPTPDPQLPDSIVEKIDELIAIEAQTAMLASRLGTTPEALAAGQEGMLSEVEPDGGVSIDRIKERRRKLMAEARVAARKRAREEAAEHERVIDDFLVEGGFYEALSDVLHDLPLFPFAVLKGPVVRIVPTLKWVDRKPVQQNVPRMFWERVSPFDFYWSPGATDIKYANVIEVVRYTRTELNALLGLPGYDEDAIREVLREYADGYTEPLLSSGEAEQAELEGRENPVLNESGLITCLLFSGFVQGRLLREHGWPASKVRDEDRDYAVQAWLIGRHVIKLQMNPSPSGRTPYYITSFNKMPGTLVGNALPDVLHDIQETANAALRALNNNMAMSSGPQVVVVEDMLAPNEDPDTLYPWKRWRTVLPQSGLASVNQRPVDFFQPNSNAQVLLGVYEKFTQIADELSAIPRYITGSDRMGGAGRTASGLAMLMNNASKILQTVAANVDNDIIKPVVQQLHEFLVLTDEQQRFRGDEKIVVKGVTVAIQKETERQRALELLQATTNPMDAAILGMRGRALLLRQVADAIGMDGELLVPPDDEIMRREQAAQAVQSLQMAQAPQAPSVGDRLTPDRGGNAPRAAAGAPPIATPANPAPPAAPVNTVL